MIVQTDMIQGSEEWFSFKKGRASASQFSKILTSTGAASKQSVGYMRKLTRECVCSDPMEFDGNKYTDWGNDTEPLAREEFVRVTGLKGLEVGFCSPDNGDPIGASPDWLIHDDERIWRGGLEIKCPQVDTHIDYLIENVLPTKYKLQVHGSMAVTGLPYWYFMSYFPGLNPLILKIERDEFTAKVESSLIEFVSDYAIEREKVLALILPTEDTLF
jgi:hypothetical protein